MLVICAVLVSYVSGQKVNLATQDYYMCVLWLYEIKYFAGNFSSCIITNNEYISLTKVHKCKKHSFDISKVVDKSSNVINCHLFIH